MYNSLNEALAIDVNANPRFHDDLSQLLRIQLIKSSGQSVDMLGEVPVKRLIESSLILATSQNEQLQRLAYEIAISLFETVAQDLPKLRDVAQLVFTRLGNIPAVRLLGQSLDSLPTNLWVESEFA